MLAFFIQIVAFVASISPLNFDALTTARAYRGAAVDLRTGTSLYVEEHQEIVADGRRTRLTSLYRDAGGAIIAERTVDYAADRFVPSFRFEDKRSGYVEGAESVSGRVRLYTRASTGDEMREKLLAIPSPAVVDAGFNEFIQAHWGEIVSGQTMKMNFGVPSRLDYFRFRIIKVDESTTSGQSSVVVRCELDNMFLRWLADPITLTYDRETRRMISYEGISNVSDEQGNNHAVRIVFDPAGP
jgi:hypothetical protein